jgi:hypothetical protein
MRLWAGKSEPESAFGTLVAKAPSAPGRSSARRSNLGRVAEYRASFDVSTSFSNGGDLTARGFRVDVPSPDVSQAEIAER